MPLSRRAERKRSTAAERRGYNIASFYRHFRTHSRAESVIKNATRREGVSFVARRLQQEDRYVAARDVVLGFLSSSIEERGG